MVALGMNTDLKSKDSEMNLGDKFRGPELVAVDLADEIERQNE